jgi:hypothetical protein
MVECKGGEQAPARARISNEGTGLIPQDMAATGCRDAIERTE